MTRKYNYLEERNCALCGEIFTILGPAQMYCCPGHRRIAKRDVTGYIAYLFLTGEPLECEVCSEDLTKYIMGEVKVGVGNYKWVVHHKNRIHTDNSSFDNHQLLCHTCHRKITGTQREITQEMRDKISATLLGRKRGPRSVEDREKMRRGWAKRKERINGTSTNKSI